MADNDPAAILSVKKEKVGQLIASKNNIDALVTALENPPLGVEDAEIKAETLKVVISVIAVIPAAGIEEAAADEKLSGEHLDTLMKYIYKGMEGSLENQKLLKWHAAVHKRAGSSVGSIVRVIAGTEQV